MEGISKHRNKNLIMWHKSEEDFFKTAASVFISYILKVKRCLVQNGTLWTCI